ncbi:MAG: hypothetical protein L0G87_09130 [Renibacterium salmoninarum]|nr:hypothetical protein [Renibacterium salmoninarum]
MSGLQKTPGARLAGGIATGLLGVLLLAGCSGNTQTPAVSSLSSSGTSTAAPGPADLMLAQVTSALGTLAGQSPKPSQDQVRSALQGLAATPSAVEVSISKTPTGLEVEAVQGSVKVDKSCVIGEIRNGAVSTTVQPVLPTGLCFVGDQR